MPLYLAGIFVGATSGFFGGGGGMLCVPLLQKLGLNVKSAHATALFVMMPICALCAGIYIYSGYFEPKTVFCAIVGVCLGSYVGAMLLNKLNATVVAALFSALMIAVGIRLMIP